MKNNDKGITLIALVVTIIVLLILAGATISTTIKGGGLFEKAKSSVSKYNSAAYEEAQALERYANIYDNMGDNLAQEEIKPIDKAYTVGQEVKVAGEPFYVIETSAAGETNVKLLSKYNIDTDTNKQSSTNYTATYYNQDEFYEGSNIESIVNNYVSSLGVSTSYAGILTKDGFNNLASNSFATATNYWLNTWGDGMRAGAARCWYFVYEGKLNAEPDYWHIPNTGVRPVIIVKKSSIK